MDITNIEAEELKELANVFANFAAHKPTDSVGNDHVNYDDFIGKKVLVRTYASGDHFGTLKQWIGREVILTDSRILYYWNNAFTLNQVVRDGVGDKSEVSVSASEVVLLDAISIYKLKDEVYNNLCKYEKDIRK